MTNMTNRTALVTGASRGIGRAVAQALSDAGARVILAARDAKKLEEAAMQIPRATCVAIDLASPESIKDAFARRARSTFW
jgi:NAD(P)-dependent dehydrogenase (short-subunit alcohol dehydrogenase family)